jgi:uncharacterized membrane protein YfcA
MARAFAGGADTREGQDMESLWMVVALGAGVAGFVQGLSGFAFGMVAMSLWAWVLPPQLAAVLVVWGALLGQLLAAFTVRRGWSWALLLPFVLGGWQAFRWGCGCCRSWTCAGSRRCWAACWCCGAR